MDSGRSVNRPDAAGSGSSFNTDVFVWKADEVIIRLLFPDSFSFIVLYRQLVSINTVANGSWHL